MAATETPAYRNLEAYLYNTRTKQKDFAKRAGISEQHLSAILAGVRRPSLPIAVKLAALANIPVESFLKK